MNKSLKQLGEYKAEISSALFKSEAIRELLLGMDYKRKYESVEAILKERIKSHEFVDEVVEDANTYIYYDIVLPRVGSTVKSAVMLIYIICDRKELDTIKSYNYNDELLMGNRADILACVVDDIISNNKDLGIGLPDLEVVEICKINNFYGRYLKYTTSDFR